MEITEVRVKLVEKSKERLRAFCSITFDGAFVIRDLKVIGSGAGDGVFVAMPSRKLCDRCPRCRAKNHLRARFCNECGHSLGERRVARDSHGRAKIHADVAHPINTECREMIQTAVIKAYGEELERSKSPEYRPPKFDEIDEAFIDDIDGPGIMESGDRTDSSPATDSDEHSEVLEDDAQRNESAFSDYDSLIADLKKEAASREDRRKEKHGSHRTANAPPAQQEAALSTRQEPAEDGQAERPSDLDRRDRKWQPRQPDPPESRNGPARPRQEPPPSEPLPASPAAQSASTIHRQESKSDDVFGAGLG